MANFAPSALVAGQAVFTEQMQSAEWRFPDIAAAQVANAGALANPDLASLRTSPLRSVTVKFPVRQAQTGGTVRVANHTGARGDSDTETISWTKFVEPFSISMKQADNNVMSWAQMYAATRLNAMYNLLNRIDAWFVAQLLADKTQQNVGGANGTFDSVNFNYDVPATKANTFFAEIKTMMERNLYGGPLVGVLDSKAHALKMEKSSQGTANNTNLAWTVAGFQNLIHTTRELLDPSGNEGSGLFFPAALVGVIPWIPQLNRKPLDAVQAMSSEVGAFGSISAPGLGWQFAVSGYATRADTSSAQGDEQDVVYQEELSIDVGYVSAPLGTLRGSNDSVVYAAQLLS